MFDASQYRPRIVDDELDLLSRGLAAVSLEGAKGVGKTATALQRARTVHRLDDADELALTAADRGRLLEGERPVLIDEWQRFPSSWDMVRRAVDDGAPAGSFLLTGSASPAPGAPTHSGAGRIVQLRMRPLTLAERGIETPTVSLAALLRGDGARLGGETGIRLADYAREIVASGFPGLRGLDERLVRAQLDGYVARITEHDFPAQGRALRNPAGLLRWLTAYAAASSTTASFEAIRDASTGGEGEKPAKTTVIPYRDVLERLWILDPIPAWAPTRSSLRSLSFPPKHQLVDPALAARLLGAGTDVLLRPDGHPGIPTLPRVGPLLGSLFESLVTLDVRVYAQAAEARVGHLRTARGEHEIDLIVERHDRRVLAIEVKLADVIDDKHVTHLRWLRAQLGDDLLDAVVINTGKHAYRREDGIAVVPAALLGP